MSSAGKIDQQNIALYLWDDALPLDDYIIAEYEVTTNIQPQHAAVAMAMEQSVGTSKIQHYLDGIELSTFTIRVRDIEQLPEEVCSPVSAYSLVTAVYPQEARDQHTYAIRLAIPKKILMNKPVQFWNILVGELPRLGFLTRFRFKDIQLGDDFGPGPAFGIEGIRQLSGVQHGPLLCRSMRPALGLDTETMAALNQDTLVGGFHLVKDDELMLFENFEKFKVHVLAMLAARDRARAASNEKKLYIANLLCEPWELQERWDFCCEQGVDGVLIAPWIQGLGFLQYLAEQKKMFILAHNTFLEIFNRHPDWRVSDRVIFKCLRALGADMFVTPGNFGEANYQGEEFLSACRDSRETIKKPMLPILQGGKHPNGLSDYHRAVGCDDFMLIVASWIDEYPLGLARGAAAFRDALQISSTNNPK
ncbi:RuBisCO large subunit C-terminal-like domain-containing protein [Undibacterium fentianense]|uniref:Ribulose bisphosphate carboxylase large subunit C-terminal domain-containing protein n=1 Tax=Undibacterium fentianense TaxID=2828728 RepID=A0A941IFJ9_9BURK|nr:RuBisCO large subunit C-terminal-like domain-containing protein [Undibacterium fentianense]MBR7799110.1 hypothetical protein [Undibacterium fentianense]